MIRETFGKKIGMTQIFDGNKDLVGVTLVEVNPIGVLEKVDYASKCVARIGFCKVDENKKNKIKKPVLGYFKKLSVKPYKYIKEVLLEKNIDPSFFTQTGMTKTELLSEQAPAVETGEAGTTSSVEQKKGDEQIRNIREVGVELFKEGDVVDIRGKIKGRGFAGGMKRHGWKGQPASHGSMTHRRIGSCGSNTTPGRVVRGHNMAGHMGNTYRTTKNLTIIKVDKEKELLFIKGAVPGHRGTILKIKKVS